MEELNFFYANLNKDNVCVGISSLSGEVPEYNYIERENYDPITEVTTKTNVFVSRMIKIPVYSDNYIGLRYNDYFEKWEVVS